MRKQIGAVTLLVRDYAEAIRFYVDAMGFRVVADTVISADKRWVLVAPPGSQTPCLLLAKASTAEQQRYVGNQTGGRVFLFLHTDDCRRDYAEMQARGIRFCESPREEGYGTVAVFEDLYGNRWDLLQLKPLHPNYDL